MKSTSQIKLLLILLVYAFLPGCEKDKPYIEITWPEENPLWFNNREYSIKWNDNIDGNVNIELFRDNEKITVLESNVPDNGEYKWMIRNTDAGEGYTIRVISVQDNNVHGESTRIEIGSGIQKLPFSNYTIEDLVVGDKSLQLYTGGSGTTTIIFEHGLGGDASVWFTNMLLGAVAEEDAFIAYNRSGYPPSTYNGEDRGMENISKDLDSIIIKKCPNQDVILVGWSWGGAIIRYFAVNHPDRIKALLFIDPTVEIDAYPFTQEQEDALIKDFQDSGNEGAAIEAEQYVETHAVLSGLSSLPDIPVVIITSTESSSSVVIDAHAGLGEGISDFTHILTSYSGHGIQIEEPELVYHYLKILTDLL